MKFFITSVFLYLTLMSCTKKYDPVSVVNSTNMDTIIKTNQDTLQKTFLALGDSYTIGQSVLPDERFPAQSVEQLRNLHFNFSDPDIIATTGWTTSDLLYALSVHPPTHNYSVVTLLIGVNNQYQRGSLSDYRNEFSQLLDSAILYAGNNPHHVFVLSIPDYSVTPFAHGFDVAKIAAEIDAFNEANKIISLHANVHYIDITSISREAKDDASLIAGDGLHPSGAQYAKWSNLLVPAISTEIK